jgi:hypothetical protein
MEGYQYARTSFFCEPPADLWRSVLSLYDIMRADREELSAGEVKRFE